MIRSRGWESVVEEWGEMSEGEDGRKKDGSSSDRRMSTALATATGAGASLAIGATDWFFQCYTLGHWRFVPPGQQLIEMGAPILVLPLGLWISRVIGLIGDIVVNNLQRADRPEDKK